MLKADLFLYIIVEKLVKIMPVLLVALVATLGMGIGKQVYAWDGGGFGPGWYHHFFHHYWGGGGGGYLSEYQGSGCCNYQPSQQGCCQGPTEQSNCCGSEGYTPDQYQQQGTSQETHVNVINSPGATVSTTQASNQQQTQNPLQHLVGDLCGLAQVNCNQEQVQPYQGQEGP